MDCVGLIIYVAQALDIEIKAETNYRKIPKRQAITRAAQEFNFVEKPVSSMVPGDILLLTFGKYLEHAVFFSDRGIIHACEKYGKIVEHRLDPVWQARITRVYEFPKNIQLKA